MDLARAMHEERFGSGTVVCEEGDVGNCMYLVVEGEVDVLAGTRKVAEMGADDFFGEMALLDLNLDGTQTLQVRREEMLALVRP